MTKIVAQRTMLGLFAAAFLYGCGSTDQPGNGTPDAGGNSHSDADADADTDADADADTDADADSDSDADADSDSDADADSDSDADADSDSDADADSDSDVDADADSDTDTDTDGDSDTDGDTDTDTDADLCAAPFECHRDCSYYDDAVQVPGRCEGADEGDMCCDMDGGGTDGDTDSDTDGDTDADTDGDTDADTDGDTDTDTDTDTDVVTECPLSESATPSGNNWVNGDLITINDSGGWCWYQDERAIVDKDENMLIVGSVQNSQAHVVNWDIAAGSGQKHTLDTNLPYTDDHDTAAIVKTKDGGYAAMWAGHKNDGLSRFSHYHDGSWSPRQDYNWGSNQGDGITYANCYYLGETIYCYCRSTDTSPNYLYSEDHGRSWDFGGRLTSTPRVGYVAGYYRYWGNNEDRIDFLATEAHPRDNDNSLYHGYIFDGKIHNSFGEVVDNDFTDRNANQVTEYTQAFRTGSTIGGFTINHAWNADVVRYDNGDVAFIGTGRVAGTGSDDPQKVLFYGRFDGSGWKLTFLAEAGTKLYSSEQDYTGLGSLDPDNPEVLYISTPFDPSTGEGEFYGHKEIWKGVTCDGGDSFEWTPITANSQFDNLRPIVPKWDTSHRAVLWLRGSTSHDPDYVSAQEYYLSVVGIIEGE